MFKLAKILNSASNVVEPCRMPRGKGASYRLGSLALLKSGALENAAATETPTFVIGESLTDEAASTVLCYPISPDMIFEAVRNGDPTSLVPGARVTLDIVDGSAVGVTASTSGGVCEIFNLGGAKNVGDAVFVRIV